ncbi:sensor histidine kinase [Pseudomonas sp. KNUC1026]|uniref:sensor histidine kinase n=1 Tax=Pseudomonas sp. KNUC1026 TaxID=2893890 RepID=UPI001F2481EC|nr:HAMP domain-containing sensor histidine kinase [Pseudomonas sp. KNUC1026]UFH51488.1 HAMP domain-containing histidine kinase [Pseudomonas sp. KNUC1026]
MDFKYTLSKRIVIAFAAMSAFVAGTFAVGIVASERVMEGRLTELSLAGNLRRLLMQESQEMWMHRPEKDELFYIQGGRDDFALPANLEALSRGFHEIGEGDDAYYAAVEIVQGRKYVLLRNQQSLMQRQRILYSVAVAGFSLSVALAVLLGWLIARRVIAPVTRLATQVRGTSALPVGMVPANTTTWAEDEVGELAASYNQTQGRLADALRREQQFTSDVSHELQLPIHILDDACQSLAQANEGEPRMQRQVLRIGRAIEQMEGLVSTFLLLARDYDDPSLRAEVTTLAAAADQSIDTWAQSIREKGLAFEHVLEGDLSETWNSTLLLSVMGNLLRNAWHYTEEGFIRLTVRPGEFKVEDSGIGIPEEKRHAMFQPFVRGDEKRGEGLGLGLSLVQRICQDQSWTVKLTGREPQGCCFTVTLRPQR